MSSKKTIQERVDALEKKMERRGVIIPVVNITRILMDEKVQVAEGLKLREKENTSKNTWIVAGVEVELPPTIHYHLKVWCVAAGGMQSPKAFGYGWTIDEALTSAEKKVKAALRPAKRKRA
mgnify:CR=1 FL=1